MFQLFRAPVLNLHPCKADLGNGTHGPRTLTRFNAAEEKNNRLARIAPQNRPLALLVDLRSTITAVFTVELGMAHDSTRPWLARLGLARRTAHGLSLDLMRSFPNAFCLAAAFPARRF
jgi:hypothetical protein